MSFVMNCLDVNEKGELRIGGADLIEVAKKYGTPAYVMDENEIRRNCRVYTKAMDDYYDGNGIVLYASKALSCKYI